MIELPSAFAESGAYPPDRALPGCPRQCSLPLAFRHTSRRAPNWSWEEARTWEHHPQPTIPPPRLNRQAKSRRQPVGCISRGWVRPYTRRKDLPTLYKFASLVAKRPWRANQHEYACLGLSCPWPFPSSSRSGILLLIQLLAVVQP